MTKARTALALLTVVLAACGGPPADDDSIRRGNGGEPGSLDPALAEDIHAFNVLTDLYEGLVVAGPAGQIEPGVARDWSVSDDGLTWDFQLREDATWSNGDPVLAADFERGLRRAVNPATLSAYAFLLAPLENFDAVQSGQQAPAALGVEAIAARELRIRLSRPTGHLLSLLSMPVALPVHPATADSGRFADPATFIGNGPYLLEELNVGSDIRLRRNERFREAGAVASGSVIYLPVADPQVELAMYRAGELDITHTVPAEALPRLRESMPDALQVAPLLALYYLAFDLEEPRMADPDIRRVLSMAIDREVIVELLGRGETPAYGIVPPGTRGHEPARYEWRNLPIDTRREAGREVLAERGFDERNPLTLTLLYDAGDVHERIALAVAGMWQESLPVVVRTERREWKYFLASRDDRPAWDVMRFAWFGDYDAAGTFLDIFTHDSPQNLAGYRSAEYDALVARATSAIDAAQRAKAGQAAERRLLSDYPVAPLYFYVSKHLVRPGLSGFEPNVLDRHPSRYLRRTPREN